AGPYVYVGHNNIFGNHREFTHGEEGSQLVVYQKVGNYAIYGSYTVFDSNEVNGNHVDCRNGCTGPTGCVIAPTKFLTNGGEFWSADHVYLINNHIFDHMGGGV